MLKGVRTLSCATLMFLDILQSVRLSYLQVVLQNNCLECSSLSEVIVSNKVISSGVSQLIQ